MKYMHMYIYIHIHAYILGHMREPCVFLLLVPIHIVKPRADAAGFGPLLPVHAAHGSRHPDLSPSNLPQGLGLWAEALGIFRVWG